MAPDFNNGTLFKWPHIFKFYFEILHFEFIRDKMFYSPVTEMLK